MRSEALCCSDLLCSRFHPPAWSGPPWHQAWEHSAAGHPVPAGQTGRLRPHPETRNLHPLHIGHAAIYGSWAVRYGLGGRSEGGDSPSAPCGAHSRHLCICRASFLYPHGLLPLGALQRQRWFLRGVCRLAQISEENPRAISVEKIHAYEHSDVQEDVSTGSQWEVLRRGGQRLRG